MAVFGDENRKMAHLAFFFENFLPKYWVQVTPWTICVHYLFKNCTVTFFYILVTALRPASPGFATWRRGPISVFFAILAIFVILAIFLAHCDPWTICDNSLQ